MLEALHAIRANFVIGRAFMAREFRGFNPPEVQAWFERRLHPAPVPTRFWSRRNMRPVIVGASQRITEPGAQGTTKQVIPRSGVLPNVTQEAVASRAASSPCRPARRTRRG